MQSQGAPQGYALLAPIFRACVLQDNGMPIGPEADRERATAQMRSWVEAELSKTGRVVELPAPLLLEKLRSTARELVADSFQIGPAADGASWFEELLVPTPELPYRHLDFVHDVLCDPPTQISLLARKLSVPVAQVRDWLLDEPRSAESANVASRLLALLIDLCGEPEEPQRVELRAPLRSFGELVVLGGLRHSFLKLYGTDRPKLAQAAFVPPVLNALLARFSEGTGGRLCVIAPTNGGKNGIMLAAGLLAVAWDEGPVLVLQPYRAQVAESLRTWREGVAGRPVAHRRSGETRAVRVAGSSALISDLDSDILSGRVDISAIIPEKLAVLSRHRDLGRFCRLLVTDEIGQLFSPERGPKLEIMLTLAKEAGLPILAAGAAVSEVAAARVSRWLADLEPDEDPRRSGVLVHDPNLQRDPPIEYWVWRRDGKRRFWREGMKPLDPDQFDTEPLVAHTEEDAVAELVVRELTASPERQILVFIENRERVIVVADLIARTLRNEPAASRLDSAAGDGQATLREIWLGGNLPSPADVPSIIEQRVGIHTRDVPSNNLERIEDAFRNGRLRVLCATTTVEAGINLPVDTVVQVGLVDHAGGKLSPRALEQRLGRSGRTIEGKDRPGRGIVYIHDTSHGIERVIKTRILQPDDACDSQLDNDYRALLLLAYLGSSGEREGMANERTEEDLRRVLGRSYWAHGRGAPRVQVATSSAIESLRQYHLVEQWSVHEDGDPRSGWRATHLGQALSAALLLPKDAPALTQIVRAARDGIAGSDEWLAEVLYAACQVPTIREKDRRPRFDDVLAKHPMRPKAVFRGWVRGDQTFGFPRAPARMPGGPRVKDALERASRDALRSGEADALLRTYVAWLWTRGYALSGDHLDLAQYVKHLNEHVVRQDLAYHLSHVLRAAGWLAQYEGTFVVGLRLMELSRQVDLGIPTAAVEFFATCGQHLSRQEVAAVRDGHYRALLKGLEPRLAADLEERLDKRRDRRRDRERRTALAQSVVDSEEKLARFDRMQTAEDLCSLLGAVWDPAVRQPLTLDDRTIQVGALLVEFSAGELREGYQSEADLVISAVPLPDEVAVSRNPQPVSLLGVEEFVVLATQLAGRAADVQTRILKALAERRCVCYRELISAVAGDTAGGWVEGSTEELGLIAEPRPTRPAQLRRATSTGPEVLLDRESAAVRDHALSALDQLLPIIDTNVVDWIRIVRSDAPPPQARDFLRLWRQRRAKAEELRAKIAQASDARILELLLRDLNALGTECLEHAWDPVPPKAGQS